ncbi:hypothetical protein C8A01DRAFT_17749 [Parachaetomium inaequale]|uniref:Ankyrin repeat protein n=1 Tax=Parachaetomium inaequale TaxID=2588326 RepID=A0AAN6PDW3_9PEZI|nr:hypothetical protein C8A01DRAFT_17749 [Parachaetomium inaequale]
MAGGGSGDGEADDIVKNKPLAKNETGDNHLETLKQAILDGNNASLQAVLEAHPHLVNAKIGIHHGTAVHYAIRNGNGDKGTERGRQDMLRIMAAIPDVDWNATDRSGRTPLHVACSHTRNYAEIAQFLLGHGADPNLLDGTQCTPLHDAVGEGQKDMITNLLLSRDPDMVDLRDVDGFTPLHDASRKNKTEVAERLIEAEANVNAKTKRGATPLHLAASNNALAAAEVLLRAGALSVFNYAKERPEKVAQRKGHTAMGELLHTPVDVDTNLARSGRGRRVSQPTEAQQAANKRLEGFVLPSMDGDFKRDRATVFDLLYGEEPKLKESRKSRGVRWIHIPSNNVRRHQDDSHPLVSGCVSMTDLDSEQRTLPVPDETGTIWPVYPPKDVLDFINIQFAEFDASSLHIQPHFKVHRHPGSNGTRPENPTFRMFSLVFPVIDVDVQQPVYFNPGLVPPESSPASKPDGESDNKHSEQISRLEVLEKAYPETVNKCRTLDGYIHEFMEALDLNFRNGDQVVSRFIKRDRYDMSRYNSPSEQRIPTPVTKEKTTAPETGVRKRKGRNSNGTLGPPGSGKNDDRTWEKSVTPAQLESQHGERRELSWSRAQLSRILQHAENLLKGNVWSGVEQPLSRKEPAPNIDDGWQLGNLDDVESVDSDGDKDHKAEPKGKFIPQQILTVPQIWLWAVEDMDLEDIADWTLLAESWGVPDSSILPQTILQRLLWKRNPTVDSIIQDIVMVCLEFEPSISTSSSSHSYLDVFGAEISFIVILDQQSGKVTKCYENFKTILGKTVKIFPDAIKEETELLIRVDDILNEISMIKRIQQEQDHLCASVRASQGQHMQGPPHASTAGSSRRRNSPRWENRTSLNAQHGLAMGRGLNELRSPRSQHVLARFTKLEEDATRIRNSIITLLDLRQRQATTENAISSARQSRVLFLFTVVTVIFAPLSWVSSLMALDIDQFTPGKESRWYRVDVFGASCKYLPYLHTILVMLSASSGC